MTYSIALGNLVNFLNGSSALFTAICRCQQTSIPLSCNIPFIRKNLESLSPLSTARLASCFIAKVMLMAYLFLAHSCALRRYGTGQKNVPQGGHWHLEACLGKS